MKENRLVKMSIVFMALVLLAIVLQTFQQVMRPLAIAVLLIFIVTPLARFSREKKIPVWLTFTGVFLLCVLLLSLVSSLVYVENVNFKKELPLYKERINYESQRILALTSKTGFGIKDISPDKISKLAVEGLRRGLGAAQAIFSETLLALILLMFLLQAYPGVFKAVERRYGEDEVLRLEETTRKIETDILAYFGTKSAMSLGTAIGSGIVLLLFGAKFISTSLLVIFLLNFIPIIGSLVAVVFVLLLYALTFGVSMSVLWLLIALLAVQFFFGNILEPKMTGSRLNMSPILIIFSLYIWGWIWGIIGMLLSVPLMIVIMIVIRHLGSPETGDGADDVAAS